MHIMAVYWFSRCCRYFGHSGVGMYCMVLGGMVMIVCVCVYVVDREGVLFVIQYDDGCGNLMFLGFHPGPMD